MPSIKAGDGATVQEAEMTCRHEGVRRGQGGVRRGRAGTGRGQGRTRRHEEGSGEDVQA